MTNMEIDQNKTCQLLGQMRTGHSSNMELESHILGTPDLRGRKNTIFIKSSLPNDLSEFRESEPIGICKNINSIHDQGRGYL